MARPCVSGSGQISCHAPNPRDFTIQNGETRGQVFSPAHSNARQPWQVRTGPAGPVPEGRERNPPRETPQAGVRLEDKRPFEAGAAGVGRFQEPGSPVSTRGRGPPEALARAPVWRHNSSGRRPRLPSCVRNSASRMPAWLRSQPTGARTTRPPSAWPSWNCGPHADARRHAAACGLTIRMSAQSFRAAVLVRPGHEILLRKNVASPS